MNVSFLIIWRIEIAKIVPIASVQIPELYSIKY